MAGSISHFNLSGMAANHLWAKKVAFEFLGKVIHKLKNVKLGYQKDNNAAVHSVDIYIFYAVIHLHLHA